MQQSASLLNPYMEILSIDKCCMQPKTLDSSVKITPTKLLSNISLYSCTICINTFRAFYDFPYADKDVKETL